MSNKGVKNTNFAKKRKFHDAQAEITEQYELLKKAGYISEGLSELAHANINRPDRDNPENVTENMIFNIWLYEEE